MFTSLHNAFKKALCNVFNTYKLHIISDNEISPNRYFHYKHPVCISNYIHLVKKQHNYLERCSTEHRINKRIVDFGITVIIMNTFDISNKKIFFFVMSESLLSLLSLLSILYRIV